MVDPKATSAYVNFSEVNKSINAAFTETDLITTIKQGQDYVTEFLRGKDVFHCPENMI